MDRQLKYSRVLGSNEGINIVIGLILGLFVLFSPIATGLIEFISPWFAVVLIFIVFATVALKMFGGGFESLNSLRVIAFVVILLVMVIGSLSYLRQQVIVPGENGTTTDYSKTSTVLFHPKILGVIFIMIIAIFTVVLMAGKQF